MTINHSHNDESRSSGKRNNSLRNAAKSQSSPSKDAEKKHGSIEDGLCHKALCDRQNAISFVETYLPEVAAEFDAQKLVISPTEFYNEALTKNTLDFAYEIPSKTNADEELILTIALEHKSQGGLRSERETLEQLFYYFALLCRRQRFEKKPDAESSGTRARVQRQRSKFAQPLVVLLYTGKKLDYEPPKWEDHYPLPKSLAQFQLKFPILCVNWTKMYREGRIGGDPLVSVPASLLSATTLKELPASLAKIFAEVNKVKTIGDRERDLLNAYVTYVRKAFNNMGRAVMQSDLDSIFGAIQKTNGRKAMEAIVGDVFLDASRESHAVGVAEGLVKGRAETSVEYITRLLTRKFGNPSEGTVMLLNQINDLNRLGDIFDYVATDATDLDDAEQFIQNEFKG